MVASKGVKTHTLDEEGKTVTDPHARNSAANGALYAQNILDGLVKADPEDKAALTSSGKRYIDQLTSRRLGSAVQRHSAGQAQGPDQP